tara:strand:- start:54 stop:590 length:537 start_codon:yes stop_codon:yes gene_type:complete
MNNEASLEPLNDKEVEDFLARQRRAQEDSEWKVSTGVKEAMAKAERLQKKIALQKALAKNKDPLKDPAVRRKADEVAQRAAFSKPYNDLLKGKIVRGAVYMSPEEAEEYGFYSQPLVIHFTDGTKIVPLSDEEGNDGGAYEVTNKIAAINPARPRKKSDPKWYQPSPHRFKIGVLRDD